MKDIDREQFWDNKILGWEDDKYSTPKGLLRRVFDVNRPLKIRQQITENVLTRVVRDQIVLEIGCGSARLVPAILEAGARKYIGLDISKVAIENAAGKAAQSGISDRVEFHHFDARQLSGLKADISFSLGLLDWLELEEIRTMLSQISCKYYFHSFSERRRSLQQIIHRMYVYAFYGHSTKSYVPKYYTQDQMLEIFAACYGRPPRFYRPAVSFMAFIYHLEDGIEITN
jgi:SAM-dependent methyltransferase